VKSRSYRYNDPTDIINAHRERERGAMSADSHLWRVRRKMANALLSRSVIDESDRPTGRG